MADNTAIEWADHTFNPWEGCQKLGPGCAGCYAEVRNARFNGGTAVNWGPGAPRRRTSAANWRKPLAWQKDAARFMAEHGRRQRVFCASLADVFDNAVDPEWREDLFDLIRETPDLDWLLLTKRIGNVSAMIDRDGAIAGNGARYLPENVWLGATVVNQAEADRDIPKLLEAKADLGARVVFLSMEPLLGPVNLMEVDHERDRGWEESMNALVAFTAEQQLEEWGEPGPGRPRIDWVIVGGESGPNARPMHPDWARSLRDQCAAAGVPFFFKQWGEWAPDDGEGRTDKLTKVISAPAMTWADGGWHKLPKLISERSPNGDYDVHRLGKKLAGRLLDGVQHDGFPRLREKSEARAETLS